MQECKEQWNQFCLDPAPPKLSPQEYIDQYLETRDEKYPSWFLHWHEPAINHRIQSTMGTYAMEGHFDGLKGAYLLGMTLALQKFDKSRGASFLAFKEFYIHS